MPAKNPKTKKTAAKAPGARKTVKKSAAPCKGASRKKTGKGAATPKKKAAKKAKTTKTAKAKSSKVTKKAEPSRARSSAKPVSAASKASRSKKAKTVARKRAKAGGRASKSPKLTAEQKKAIRAERAARRKMVARFRALLMRKQQDVLHAYHSTKGATLDRSTDGTEDYIDYAVSSYDRDFMLSLTELERKQLHLVEEALARIGKGEFGRCLECGQEIPLKRLEVEAWARYCIRCQELDEQGLLEEHPSSAETDGEGEEPSGAESASPSDSEADVEIDAKILDVDQNEPDEELV